LRADVGVGPEGFASALEQLPSRLVASDYCACTGIVELRYAANRRGEISPN